MRFPVPMAKKLGEITANYRWFAVVYILSAFFLIPLIVFGLSLAGWSVKQKIQLLHIFSFFRPVFGGVLGPIVLIIIIVIIINLLQSYKPNYLPAKLRTWSWLPRPLRSLGLV